MLRISTFSFVTLSLILLTVRCVNAQKPVLREQHQIENGADQTTAYLSIIKNKRIGVVANHSSMIGSKHLVDSLLKHGIAIQKIFTPEHGLRGTADAGASLASGVDSTTGLHIVSLYGDKKAPSATDLQDIELMLFDLQDVGVRFYTYISTLTYVMEACAKANIPLIVLDRPNPNGFYVDGPVLEPSFQSFVGLHPVPVVYGLTIGEYALMVNGEGWLKERLKCDLNVIKLKGYTHNMIVKLKLPPSPNLRNWKAIYLYPSLCLFEGTVVSVGRGTDVPFEVYGHPLIVSGSYKFKPKPVTGASKPKLVGELCFGYNLGSNAEDFALKPAQIDLHPLLQTYKELGNKTNFFNNYFKTLSGTDKLQKQIEAGLDATAIRESWQNDLDRYKKVRVKYLLYPDFE